MHDNLTVLMAQINPVVGALEANRDRLICIIKANQNKHDLIVFPELALTGYPPEDLLYRKELHAAVAVHLAAIAAVTQDCYAVVGHPLQEGDNCYNAVSVLHQGLCIAQYRKQKLPNHGVFDEARYFTAGEKQPCILRIKQFTLGLCICEDLWQPGPVEDMLAQQVDLIVSPNASPFDQEKYQRRENLLTTYAKQGVGFIYVNQSGGQDGLLFDGQSMAVDNTGALCARAPAFEEDLCTVVWSRTKQCVGQVTPLLSLDALMYKALVSGTRDYVEKNNFPGVLVGLSGGIDSALTLAIAVDALGADKVHAVSMPSRYSALMSGEDAQAQAQALGVSYTVLPIEAGVEALLGTLAPVFKDKAPDSTEENIQARLRGLLLMAVSNKTGNMVLNTSNKSEVAVGYSTLYGDMVGGLAVLQDVLKTQVYALAKYRNSVSPVIPARVITRAPSAELRANQTDQDSLPDYAVLDAIITAYVVDNLSGEEIIALGCAQETVKQVLTLIKNSEHKRRQAPPGIKITPTAFGKDWRYPLTNGFN